MLLVPLFVVAWATTPRSRVQLNLVFLVFKLSVLLEASRSLQGDTRYHLSIGAGHFIWAVTSVI